MKEQLLKNLDCHDRFAFFLNYLDLSIDSNPVKMVRLLPTVKLERLKIFNCSQCPFVTCAKLDLDKHKDKCQSFKTQPRQGLRIASTSSRTICEERRLALDQQSFSSRSVVEKTENRARNYCFKKQLPEMFECVFCDSTFRSKSALKGHLIKLHLCQAQNEAQCCICGLRYDSKIILILHMRTVHKLSRDDVEEIVTKQFQEEVEDVTIQPGAEEFSSREPKSEVGGVEQMILKVDLDAVSEESYHKGSSLLSERVQPNTSNVPVTIKFATVKRLPKESDIQNEMLKHESLVDVDDVDIGADSTPGHVIDWSDDSLSSVAEVSKQLHSRSGLGSTSETINVDFSEDCMSIDKEDPETSDWMNVAVDLQCHKCNLNLKLSSDVLEHFKSAHLNEVRCFICDKNFKSQSSIKRHLFSVHLVKGSTELPKGPNEEGIVNFQCRICNISLNTVPNVLLHSEKFHKKQKECFVCETKLSRSYRVEKHLVSVHHLNLPMQLVCTQCRSYFHSLQKLKSHQKNQHSINCTDFCCSHCEKRFSTSTDDNLLNFIKHSKTEHNISIFQCELCFEIFDHRRKLSRHLAAKHRTKITNQQQKTTEFNHSNNFHNDTMVKCTICGVDYPENSLTNHYSRTHTAEITVQCDQCPQMFKCQFYLQKHKRRIHDRADERKHVCEVCGKIYKRAIDLRGHSRLIHEGTAPYACEYCGKKFIRRDKLRDHVDTVHLNKKFDLQCDQCDFSCKTPSRMLDHKQRVHEGQNKYRCVCDTCGTPCHSIQHLKRHIEIKHQGVRVKCTECDSEFVTKHSMERHVMAIHQKMQPHECPVCHQQFGIKHSLFRHVRSHHADKITLVRSKATYKLVEKETNLTAAHVL